MVARIAAGSPHAHHHRGVDRDHLVPGGPGAGSAEPKPDAKRLRSQLSALQKEYDTFIADYNANRVALSDARRIEKVAATRWEQAQRAYDLAREQVVQMTQLRYQGSSLDTAMPLLGAGDPHASIHAAALLQQRADEQAEGLKQFAITREGRRLARESAARRARELQEKAAKLGQEKRTAEKLIARIKDTLEEIVPTPGCADPMAPGRRRSRQGPTTSLPARVCFAPKPRAGSASPAASAATARARTAASTPRAAPATS